MGKQKHFRKQNTGEDDDDSNINHLDADIKVKDMVKEKLLLKNTPSARNSGNSVGTFKSMNLSPHVMKGVEKMGYRFPTPIQRKAIPMLMSGKDIVAMARTGSGKTAAFLIPMLEKLVSHSTKVGIRGMIIGPTKELSVQTKKFLQTLCCNTDLKICSLLGGESIDNQFNQLTNNPDIVIATPGRLLHIMKETGLGLSAMEYVVVDEADRCFEMGLAGQLNEIISKLPQSRQMALFSATMPTQLVEFAKVGLNDPEIIRLDADTKISPDLKTGFFTVRSQDKPAALLYFLRNMIKPDQQVIIFVSTRHHVEFLHELCTINEIDSVILYGTMDPTARKIGIGKFKAKKSNILIVTDLAARGIDIPLLETVINYDFPPKPKVYVHRVGRTARNGMPGSAWSFVANDEIPYMLDLLLFLGRPLLNVPKEGEDDFDAFYGAIPVSILDDFDPNTQILNDQFLGALKETSDKAFKLYYDTRPSPSTASLQRAKTLSNEIHPMFISKIDKMQMEKTDLLSQIKGYKPQSTVFDLKKGTLQSNMMNQRRQFLTTRSSRKSMLDRIELEAEEDEDDYSEPEEEEEPASLKDLILNPKKKSLRFVQEKKTVEAPKKSFRDEKFFISGEKPVKEQMDDQYYSLGSNLDNAVFDLGADETRTMAKLKQVLLWDVKKKKYVRKHLTEGQHVKNNKIINESGVQVAKDGKTQLYSKWKDSSKKRIQFVGETEDTKIRVDTDQLKALGAIKKKKGGKDELKTKEHIEKIHKNKEKQKKLEKTREKIKKWGIKNFKQKIHLDGMKRKQEEILSKQKSSKLRFIVKKDGKGGSRKRK